MSLKTKQTTPLPVHPFLIFRETKDKKNYELTLNELEDKDLEHNLRSMMNANLSTEKRDKGRVWILERKDLDNFLEAVEELQKGELEDDDEEESDSSTDDELIQKALARRMKSESSSDVISEDHISDSEMEDVLSLSRRLRYLMSRVQRIEKHLHF